MEGQLRQVIAEGRRTKTRSSHTKKEIGSPGISRETRADLRPGLNNLLGSNHEVVPSPQEPAENLLEKRKDFLWTAHENEICLKQILDLIDFGPHDLHIESLLTI